MLPLQYAAEYGHVDVFRILFEASEDKDPRGKHGYSLLHIAADYGKFEIADYLLRSVRYFSYIISTYIHGIVEAASTQPGIAPAI